MSHSAVLASLLPIPSSCLEIFGQKAQLPPILRVFEAFPEGSLEICLQIFLRLSQFFLLLFLHFAMLEFLGEDALQDSPVLVPQRLIGLLVALELVRNLSFSLMPSLVFGA